MNRNKKSEKNIPGFGEKNSLNVNDGKKMKTSLKSSNKNGSTLTNLLANNKNRKNENYLKEKIMSKENEIPLSSLKFRFKRDPTKTRLISNSLKLYWVYQNLVLYLSLMQNRPHVNILGAIWRFNSFTL